MNLLASAKWFPAICIGAVVLLTATPLLAGPNRELVIAAMRSLFIDKDLSAVDRYWAVDYIQHNPRGNNGNVELKKLPPHVMANIRYQMGMVVEDGDIVMVHGRYEGIGPQPMVAVDIFRVKDGKLVEHWDVLQEEVLKTVSGNPMFTPVAVKY